MERSSAREKRGDSYLFGGTSTSPPPFKQHPHRQPTGKLPRTLSLALPSQMQKVLERCPSVPPVTPKLASAEVEPKMNASVVVQEALLLRSSSETSNDSLADGIKATEALSEMTLDAVSSCPLVGPRNITTQFEQTSEMMPESESFAALSKDANQEGDELLQRQSSSVAELKRQKSFERRMIHSIAIVEEWFMSQEKVLATA